MTRCNHRSMRGVCTLAPMKTHCLLVPLIALATASSYAGKEELTVPFRPIAFAEAAAAAGREGKLVFIDFFTTWCEPCKRLDAQTWTDAAVGQLVGSKTVPLKLDAEKDGR